MTGAVPVGETDRAFQARVGEMRARRPSAVVVQTERKTEYWMELLAALEKAGNFKMDANVQNDIIARILSLQLVLDKRAREAQGITAVPDPRPILAGLEKAMYARLTELNNGNPVRLDPNTPQLERICRMEKAIQVLEARKAKEEEEEAEKVKAKVAELQSSLQNMTQEKEKQRETNRRTMKLELDTLKESMAKMQQAEPTAAASQQTGAAADAMQAKMNRLEAALRLLNEERKNNVEDKDTLLLKRKLALFEQKFQDLEAQKSVKASESEADALRDKLLMMEEKLSKMEKRKSMSMTTMMQEKMAQVEKQLEMMRSQKGGGGGGGGTDAATAQRMAQLEAELKKLQNTKITPAMVNDEETNALRGSVKKIEEAMLAAERKMEAQRKRVEEERERQAEERRKEELEFREASRKREQELLKRLQMMEQKMVGGGGGGDPALMQRLQRVEQNLAQGGGGGGGAAGPDPTMLAKMKEMEDKLMATQRALEEERNAAKQFMTMAADVGTGGGGNNVDAMQLIMAMNKTMAAKFEEQQKQMEEKMRQIAAMAAASGGGGGGKKSGLSYKEINDKLAELQKQLFDPNTDERAQEQLNIEYEKLITELESTDEYKQEQLAIREKWKKDNEPLNAYALIRVLFCPVSSRASCEARFIVVGVS